MKEDEGVRQLPGAWADALSVEPWLLAAALRFAGLSEAVEIDEETFFDAVAGARDLKFT